MKKTLFIALVSVIFLTMQAQAQNLREKLQQCPVIIENGKINYYMPQQNGAFYQLPPALKPQYVNIMHVPWVQPLTQSVQATQTETLATLLVFTTQNNQKKEDKELFLRKLAWCVMLQTSKAKQIDKEIMDCTGKLVVEDDADINSHASLVLKLIEDYKSALK